MKRFAVVAAFSVYTVLVGAASAQNAAGTAEKIAPIGRFAPTVTERTPEQMDAFAASHPLMGSPIVPFRPTMGECDVLRDNRQNGENGDGNHRVSSRDAC